ncbi:hypothetical protein K2Z84_08880 [Candidatus Binatia bacterium]|jgi:hypothetical protein|nr:hypothetical protein [Candidatus Binatia bacterium]
MEDETSRCDAGKGTCAPLPASRAFVVQLRGATEPAGELFVGRAEHMASGTAERFSSADELIAFITRMLAPADASQPAFAARRPGSVQKEEK